jgi:hypothetical protein
MSRATRLFIASVLLAAAITSAPVIARSIEADGAVTPPPTDGPVVVEAGLFVVDISNINEVDNTFDAEFDIVAYWSDPRLAFDAEEEGSGRRVYIGQRSERLRTQIWNAQGSAANAVGAWRLIGQKITVFADGKLMIEARMAATLRALLDYSRFPFDRQILPVHIESYAWDRDIVVLRPLPEATEFHPSFQLTEWDVVNVTSSISEVNRPRAPVPFSRLTCNIEISRKAGFYVWKIFVPLFVIVAISWVVFWMGREALGRRAGVSVTGILTVIAYQFIVAESIPRVSYLTVLDKMLLTSIVAIALTLLVSIVVEALDTRGKDPGPLDKVCRWLFPAAYYAIVALVIFR